MNKVTMIGTMTCQAGRGDEMEAVLVKMTAAATKEPGVEVYSYHRSEDDRFAFFAVMSDMAATQAHGQTEAMQSAMQAMGPLMAGPPEVSMYRPVAALGFDV